MMYIIHPVRVFPRLRAYCMLCSRETLVLVAIIIHTCTCSVGAKKGKESCERVELQLDSHLAWSVVYTTGNESNVDLPVPSQQIPLPE